MCGIIAGCLADDKEILPVLIDGLKQLESRGYDSFGLVTIEEGKHGQSGHFYRSTDPIHLPSEGCGLRGSMGMAHTRWATHGEADAKNAHPIVSYEPLICDPSNTRRRGVGVVVHNGIVDNADRLRDYINTLSTVDTEVISRLFAIYSWRFPSRQPSEICRIVVDKLEGDFAFVAWCQEKLVAYRRNTSLFASADGRLVASEVSAFPPGIQVRPLEDGEIFVLAEPNDQPLDPGKIHIVPERPQITDSGHSMLREIREQPDTMLQGEVVPDVRYVDDCTLIGCGSSYYASLLGTYPAWPSGPSCDCQHASEFRPPIWKSADRKFIALSQSGETKDVLDVLRNIPIPFSNKFALTNSPHSSISNFANVCDLHAGKEDGVAATKTFTSQVVTLWKSLAHVKGIELWKVITSLPDRVGEVIEKHRKDGMEFVPKLLKYRNALILGQQLNYPVALEGALKLKEVAYVHAEALPAAEVKHGPIALIDDSVLTIALMDFRLGGFNRVLSNLNEIKSRGGTILALHHPDAPTPIADFTFAVPADSMHSAAICFTVALQLLSYEWAVAKGLNPDRPKNLAKAVTV